MIGLRVSEPPIASGEADKAGIRMDDVIAKVEESTLQNVDQLIQIMTNRIGKNVSVEIIRDSSLIILKVVAGPLGVKLTPEDISFAYPNILKAKANTDIENHIPKVILTTAPWIEGRPVVETLDILSAECAFGINIIKDKAIGIVDFTGGRSIPLQSDLKDAKVYCLKKLKREAAIVRADAVIAVDLKYSEFTGGGKTMIFVVATGTAVKLHDPKEKLSFTEINDRR